jgi:hypothetical protein
MGSENDNDSLDFTDGWVKEVAEIMQNHFDETPLARWKDAEALDQKAGANAKFVLVQDVDHNRRKLQYLATGFFASVLSQQD